MYVQSPWPARHCPHCWGRWARPFAVSSVIIELQEQLRGLNEQEKGNK